MPKEPNCSSCEHAGRNCGGHWSRIREPHVIARHDRTRSRPNLDTMEGNDTGNR